MKPNAIPQPLPAQPLIDAREVNAKQTRDAIQSDRAKNGNLSNKENSEIKYPRPIPSKLRRQLDAYSSFPERIMFLDIETTGLSHYYDEITVIGWAFGGRSGTIVKGQEPHQLYADMKCAIGLVTFNGIRFDTKFLLKKFPDLPLPSTHVDLMYLCRRVGLTGGQKSIEDELGIQVREHVEGMDGIGAVILWRKFQRGDRNALKTLIHYNRADIAAMGTIFDKALSRLKTTPSLFVENVEFGKWSAPADRKELPEITESFQKGSGKSFNFSDLFGNCDADKWRIVGIDLSGSEKRRSGWCLLKGKTAKVRALHEDRELMGHTIAEKPDLVSIDSPLCLPKGRKTVRDDDPGRQEFGIMRECERELKRRGVNVYPCLIKSMQNLTERGMRLAAALRATGVPVIESYPGAAQDIMKIPRKGAGLKWLKLGLEEFGVSGDLDQATHDELDAVTSALVGTFHMAGLSEALGTKDEAPLIIPRINGKKRSFAIGLSGPIAAGKTTLARMLERKGFEYTRFSLVLDDLLKEEGKGLTRFNRQKLGAEISKSGRQRWLCQKTLSKVENAEIAVIDGLRFPDDYSYLIEQFGSKFLHVHLSANEEIRRSRFEVERQEIGFVEASGAKVEELTGELMNLAQEIFFNEGSVKKLEEFAEQLAERAQGGQPCRYQ